MKNIIIAGLCCLSSVAALAAPVKTSKAVPLSDDQMASVKGQGILSIYSWTGSSYILVYYVDVGPTSPWRTETIYNGGPQAGIYYTY